MIQIIGPTNQLASDSEVVSHFIREIPNIIFEVAKKAEELVKDRVINEGTATNGSYLVTKSNTPVGRYSSRAAKERQARGLRTDQVNLQLTGEMWDDWTTEQQGERSLVGFNSEEQADKANENEIIFETVIFQPSDANFDEIDAFLDSKIDELFW